MKCSLLLLGAALAWGQQLTPPADPVVITVGGETITKSQFEQIMATLSAQQRAQVASPAGRKRLAEQVGELKAFAQEARARKIDQEAKVKTEIALRTDQTLEQNLFESLLATAKPDAAALHAYYDAHKSDWEEVKAKHILIRFHGSALPLKPGQKDRTEAEALAFANDIRAKIVAGASFDEMAKASSDDSGNAQSGGDLGSFGKGRMVPAFEKAAFAAEPGKVTEPVKTQFGYHLILVEEHKTKPFEDVQAEIETKIKPDLAQKTMADIRKKANVVYDEAYFEK